MLTDDELSRQLSGAFHSAGADLTYLGRVPTAQRTPSPAWLAVPALAAVATVATVAAHQDGSPAPRLDATPSSPATGVHSHPGSTRIVTAKIRAAGYTFDYSHPAGEGVPANDLYADLSIDTVPADATPTESDWPGMQAWVGTDPSTGDNALYLEGSGVVGGRLFVLLSPTWTQQQLSQLVLEKVAFAVPAVGGN